MKSYYKVLSSSMFSLMLLSSGYSQVLAEEQPPLQVNAGADNDGRYDYISFQLRGSSQGS
ncbi:hypothetical protein V7157_05000 [Neobacillus drentensis]|uniref:hypothetical protein n=1 Tax=Neobacillus drentensis TaxID=220684 RepID=UPI002FFF50A1